MRIQAGILVAILLIISGAANCGTVRFEFEGIVTSVGFQANIQNEVKSGDVVKGYVDMETALAPPDIFSGSDIGFYTITSVNQKWWINAQLSVAENTFSTDGLIIQDGGVSISDQYPLSGTSGDQYGIQILIRGDTTITFDMLKKLSSDTMPSLPNFITGDSFIQNFKWNRESTNFTPPIGIFQLSVNK